MAALSSALPGPALSRRRRHLSLADGDGRDARGKLPTTNSCFCNRRKMQLTDSEHDGRDGRGARTARTAFISLSGELIAEKDHVQHVGDDLFGN